MRGVAIIGAGDLGGLLTHALARRDAADEIQLLDEEGRIAEGKALDIMQSAPVERFAARVSGSSDLTGAAGVSVVVLADHTQGGERSGGDGLMLLRRVTAFAPRAVIICAGAAHRELIERGARELSIGRTRVFGSAPEAFASTARAMVALEADVSPRDVALSVLGVPPTGTVIPWDEATIAGLSAIRILDGPARRRIEGRLPSLWPPGPYALAAAASKTIECVFERTRRLVCCYVAPDLSSGTRVRAAALPVRLGSAGIIEVVLPTLGVRDRVALDNAMTL